MNAQDSSAIEPGLIVLSAGGGRVGLVKEVESERFQVDRRMLPDLWLRTSAVSDIRGNTLVLKAHTYELSEYDASDDGEDGSGGAEAKRR